MIAWRISHRAETVSTNLDARGGAPGDVFTADFQTAGRGRLDHTWHSPRGENLIMSVVLSAGDRPPESVATLPVVMGLAVARAVTSLLKGQTPPKRGQTPPKRGQTPCLVMLKWPNDVLVNGRKVSGILCERDGKNVIVGIGVNVKVNVFPAEIEKTATSLGTVPTFSGTVPDVRDAVLAAIDAVYGLWLREGFSALWPDVSTVDFLRGQALSVRQTDDDVLPISGLCGGIQPDGSLRVGETNVYAGEAHVCRIGAHRAIVSLGSNLEPRADRLAQARELLGRLSGTRLAAESSVVETEPVDVPREFAALKFLNQVVVCETSLDVLAFFREMHAIEDRLGRRRTVRNGPRTIDLDLIDFDGIVLDEPDLTLPHPRAHARAFVLGPLAELGLSVPGETDRRHA